MNNSRDTRHGDTREEKGTVFVVDDEPLLLELAATILQPLGYQVATFPNAEAALPAFFAAQPKPDLVVTDYAMHTMNGMDFIQECRRIRPGQKIVLVSGTVDDSIYSNSLEKPDHFLAKPYQARQFVRVVETVLAK